jgi:hypothetical protein
VSSSQFQTKARAEAMQCQLSPQNGGIETTELAEKSLGWYLDQVPAACGQFMFGPPLWIAQEIHDPWRQLHTRPAPSGCIDEARTDKRPLANLRAFVTVHLHHRVVGASRAPAGRHGARMETHDIPGAATPSSPRRGGPVVPRAFERRPSGCAHSPAAGSISICSPA